MQTIMLALSLMTSGPPVAEGRFQLIQAKRVRAVRTLYPTRIPVVVFGERCILTITLPIATPSLNQLLGMHWAARSKLSKQYEIAIKLSARGAPVATGKRHLTIERHGKRSLDKDNLYGGCKLLIDAITRLGFIVDDDAEWLELEVVQVKLAKGEAAHTVIVLADLTGFPVAKVS